MQALRNMWLKKVCIQLICCRFSGHNRLPYNVRVLCTCLAGFRSPFPLLIIALLRVATQSKKHLQFYIQSSELRIDTWSSDVWIVILPSKTGLLCFVGLRHRDSFNPRAIIGRPRIQTTKRELHSATNRSKSSQLTWENPGGLFSSCVLFSFPASAIASRG